MTKKVTETIICDFCFSEIVKQDNVEVLLRGRVRRSFDLCKGCVEKLIEFFGEKAVDSGR